jgi:hypothetical protein
MNPHMAPHDLIMFYNYLDKAKIYFEYGSGGSTYQASLRKNIEKIYSIESDKEWHDRLKYMITPSENIHLIYVEILTNLVLTFFCRG